MPDETCVLVGGFAPPVPSRVMDPSPAALVGLWVLLLVVAGCSTTGLKNGVYYGDRTTFRVQELSGGWRYVEARGNAVAYHNRDLGAIIEANAVCDGAEAPLSALTQHLLIGFTERHIISQELVPLDRREAMHTVLTAKLDGVAIKLEFYVIKKNNCVYDLSYSAPPDRFAQGVSEFVRFVKGFAVLGGESTLRAVQ